MTVMRLVVNLQLKKNILVLEASTKVRMLYTIFRLLSSLVVALVISGVTLVISMGERESHLMNLLTH